MRMRLALFTGQALDAATFAIFFLVVPAFVLAAIGTKEQNPIIAVLFAIGGFAAVVVTKVGLVSWVVYRDHRRPDRPRKTAAFMGVAVASGFVGAAFNLGATLTVIDLLRQAS